MNSQLIRVSTKTKQELDNIIPHIIRNVFDSSDKSAIRKIMRAGMSYDTCISYLIKHTKL